MSIYIFIYIFSFIFSFLYSKSKDMYFSEICKISIFFILWIPLAIRCHIGTDYDNYVKFIHQYINYGINHFEIGYIPIFNVMKYFNLSDQVFFIFTSFITILSIFLAVDKKYMFIAIPAFMTSLYAFSFSGVRQAMAVALMLLASRKFYEKKYIKFLIIAIVAFFFHKSTLVLIFLLPFSLFQLRFLQRTYAKIFLFILIFILFEVLDVAGFLFNKVVGNTFYAKYLNSKFSQSSEMGSGLGFLLWLLMIFCIQFFSKLDSTTVEKKSSELIFYNMAMIFTFAYEASRIMATKMHIFGRINDLFYASYILMIICLYRSKSKYRKIVLLFLLFASVLQFTTNVKKSLASAPGGLGIVPYQSIFSK